MKLFVSIVGGAVLGAATFALYDIHTYWSGVFTAIIFIIILLYFLDAHIWKRIIH